jgi:4-carboxymuconolactone decarboxylase
MSRIQSAQESKLSPDMQAKYEAATKAATGLPATFHSLFANPQIGSGLAELHQATGRADLEPWVTLTVALTVAHERDNQSLWDSFEPLAREAGVSDVVIDGIAAGTAPRGLLPKEGIWVHFTKEVLQDKMRDSTWQSTTHLVGDEGAVALAVTAYYYDMMARLNRTLDLDTA